jgi:glycogen synthase
MKKAQRQVFSQLTSELYAIPDVDYGGCGIVAKALYKALYKQYSDISIWYLDDYDYSEEYFYNQPYTPKHVVIKIGRYYYDAGGIYSSAKLRDVWKFTNKWKVSYQYLVDSIDNSSWNPRFNRRKHAPTIRKLTKSYKALL